MTCSRITERHRMHERRGPTRNQARLHQGMRLSIHACLLVASAVAHAQPAGPAVHDDELAAEAGAGADQPARPWVEGVPFEVRLEANRIFLEGNQLMREGLFLQATERYQTALAGWDHPGFHYNLAIAQINLDQPIAAYESLQRAVRYGAAPFGPDKLEQAESFLTLLRNQLAHVEVTCDEPGAKVTLDGKPLFTAPGRHQALVLPGGHQIVASAPGRIPATEQVVLAPGQRAAVALVLHKPERTVTVRYMPAWIPWASLGVGAAVLGVGRSVEQRADRKTADFNEAFHDKCPRGCEREEAPELYVRFDDARSEQRDALRLYMAGAAALTISAALLYVNRERVVRRDALEDTVSVNPMLMPDAAGISAQIRF